MRKRTAAILTFGLLHSALLAQPLVERATAFANNKIYKRGPTPAERATGKYDCTTFVEAVLDQAGYVLNRSQRAMINIVLSKDDALRLRQLVESKDVKIQGVVNALIASHQGTAVTGLSSLQPGDIVQMWLLTAPGANGHVAVVKAVLGNGKLLMVGAHNEKDGVGQKEFTVGAEQWPIWFAVRPKALQP